ANSRPSAQGFSARSRALVYFINSSHHDHRRQIQARGEDGEAEEVGEVHGIAMTLKPVSVARVVILNRMASMSCNAFAILQTASRSALVLTEKESPTRFRALRRCAIESLLLI